MERKKKHFWLYYHVSFQTLGFNHIKTPLFDVWKYIYMALLHGSLNIWQLFSFSKFKVCYTHVEKINLMKKIGVFNGLLHCWYFFTTTYPFLIVTIEIMCKQLACNMLCSHHIEIFHYIYTYKLSQILFLYPL
jgi:hypothetical protein